MDLGGYPKLEIPKNIDSGESQHHSWNARKTPTMSGSPKLCRLPREKRSVHSVKHSNRRILITQKEEPEEEEDDEGEVGSSDDRRASGDEDYDTDLEIDVENWINADKRDLLDDPTGEKKYRETCKENGIVPITYFIRHIKNDEFRMKFRGLGPEGAKALSVPLATNNHIEKLDLEGNWIQEEGSYFISDMLKENMYITEMILADNKIGNTGADVICEILLKNDCITKLDLSGNQIGDAGAEEICSMLLKNTTLKQLLLSHNWFEEKAADEFKEALSQNERLETLDLSWNHFRSRDCIHIAAGIMENIGLKHFNFAMNGLGQEGAEEFGKALKSNRSLLSLNISYNRINTEGAGAIAIGMKTNDILQTLKIGHNPLYSEGAYAILVGIERNDSSSVNHLDLSGIQVRDDFTELEEKLKQDRTIEIIYGGVVREEYRLKIKSQNERELKDFRGDPMCKLKEYMKTSGYRLIDLFKDFDKDQSWTITKVELRKGIELAGIELTDEQIDLLMERLDKDKNQEIDFGEIVEADKEFRKEIRRWKRLEENYQPPEPMKSVLDKVLEAEQGELKIADRDFRRKERAKEETKTKNQDETAMKKSVIERVIQ